MVNNYASVVRSSSGVVAGMKFLEACSSFLSRLTSVAGRFSCTNASWIKLDSAIVSLALGADNLGATFSFSQRRFESSRQGFDDIRWFAGLLFSKKWFKRSYCFLKCRAHSFLFLLSKGYHVLLEKSMVIGGKRHRA